MTSDGAIGGFRNEDWVFEKFERLDSDAKDWLVSMGYDHTLVSRVEPRKGQPGTKPDLILDVYDLEGQILGSEKVSIKLVSQSRGFNQLDRGYTRKRYQNLWPQMPEDVLLAFELFTGEATLPGGTAEAKRLYFFELATAHQESVLNFLKDNLDQILSDVFSGRQPNQARWLLYVNRFSGGYVFVDMAMAIKFFSSGGVRPTSRGSLKLGRLTLQRKGGDSGKKTANQLQFKFDPSELEHGFDVKFFKDS